MELGEPDESGRRKPVAVEGSDFYLPCDNVLIAIGQAFDLSFIDRARDGIEINEWGQIDCDPVAGTTSVEDIFVAGDLAYGAKLLIHAVASGKAVARSIYRKMTGRRIATEATELHLPLARYEREAGFEKHPRSEPGQAHLEKRFAEGGLEVELPFTPGEARCEADRCFDCGVNTIFDGGRCVLCGGCVDVCPENCLRIVALEQMSGGGEIQEATSRQLGDFPAGAASAIIKDETICIRCGLCAERCPSGAITMERLSFEEKPACRTS